MNGPYVSAIDWLKAVGITLILYGHVAGWAPLADLPPIHSKQLGVAFFLFASGYSLSAETRERWRVAFNRLFEIYLFGVPCALLVSLVSFSLGGRGDLSNYFPFLVGANVAFNNFPANPTTWYLGTYVQIVLLWTLVSGRIRVTAGVLVASCLVEIAVRALLLETAGGYVAYMLLTNWSTVFLLGCWFQQNERKLTGAARSPSSSSTAWTLVALVLAVAGWSLLTSLMGFEQGAPFMLLRETGALNAVLVSAMVSVIYLGLTPLVYSLVSRWPAPRPVRFVARNTLIIFLAHMPVYYGLLPLMAEWRLSPVVGSSMLMVVCLPGLAWCSEGIRRLVQPRELRDRLAARLFRERGPARWGPLEERVTASRE